MTATRCFKVDKLIRDHAPEILGAHGVVVTTRIMEEPEYHQRLKDKLLEEAKEIIKANTLEERIEECADLLEVMLAFAQAHGFSMAQIEAKRCMKKAEKGGFDAKIYSDHVEVTLEPGDPELEYYCARPEDYPEMLPA